MQLHEKFSDPLKLIMILMILLAGVSLGGCDRQQQSPPRPVPEVVTVTVQPQQIVLTTELPGRTSSYLVMIDRLQMS